MSAAAQSESAAAKGPLPRYLIMSIYWLYAREPGSWLSVRTLIKLMGSVGVDAQSVRSSISRLKRRGFLISVSAGGVAGYVLSPQGREVLLRADRRMFERPRSALDETWILAVLNGIPESEREKRHQLRASLSWLGFGAVTSGVWIAPAHVNEEAQDLLQDVNLSEYVDLFRADYFAFRPLAENVETWWDLEELDRMYREFIELYGPARSRWRRRTTYDEAAFVDYVQVLTHWRRLPHLDPGLPTKLLPRNWSGSQAADIFFELHELLEAPARGYIELVDDSDETKAV